MGYNTVAVLLNDHHGEFDRDGPLGKRIASAMLVYGRGGTLDGWFGAGSVISRDHADYHQVTVVHGNTGCPIRDAKDLPYLTLLELAECLKRHGWRASPPPKRRRKRCGDCNKQWADPPSQLCPGCEVYKDHTR